jgi:hypothetical protein
MTDVKSTFASLGIDMATLKKVAGLLKDDPKIQELFKNQLKDKGFQQNVEDIYNELDEVLNHGKKSPDS